MSTTSNHEMKQAVETIHRLMYSHTKYVPAGFSIDLGHDTEDWHQAFMTVGVREACRHMAEHACSGYERYSGKPFLFSEACVAYEIKYHLDAFMVIQGYGGYHRNMAAMLLPKTLSRSRGREIDISANDARDFKQRYIFHYKKGIRACYRNTPTDPFAPKSVRNPKNP